MHVCVLPVLKPFKEVYYVIWHGPGQASEWGDQLSYLRGAGEPTDRRQERRPASPGRQLRYPFPL